MEALALSMALTAPFSWMESARDSWMEVALSSGGMLPEPPSGVWPVRCEFTFAW